MTDAQQAEHPLDLAETISKLLEDHSLRDIRAELLKHRNPKPFLYEKEQVWIIVELARRANGHISANRACDFLCERKWGGVIVPVNPKRRGGKLCLRRMKVHT